MMTIFAKNTQRYFTNPLTDEPNGDYVEESDLVQLIAEIPDETKEDDIKSLKWFDANCQEIDFSE